MSNTERVTLRDVYEAVNELRGEINQKFDRVEDELDRKLESLRRGEIIPMKDDIRELKEWKTWIMGIVATMSVGFGVLASFITDFLKEVFK